LSSADAIASPRPTLTGHPVKRFQAVPASGERYVLAEGPYWDGDRDRVLWVDIAAGEVHTGRVAASRVIPEAVLTFPETVGAVVSSHDGELLVAGARRLYTVSTEVTSAPAPRSSALTLQAASTTVAAIRRVASWLEASRSTTGFGARSSFASNLTAASS
jgi:hypothetical protein